MDHTRYQFGSVTLKKRAKGADVWEFRYYETQAALQWQDFDFERQQLLVQRSIVNGNVDDVKTEYSRDHVPLHESLIEVLLAWSKQALPTEEGHDERKASVGKFSRIGWHTFRHTYRSWLDETGAPMKCSKS